MNTLTLPGLWRSSQTPPAHLTPTGVDTCLPLLHLIALGLNFLGREEEELLCFLLELNLVVRSKESVESSDCGLVEAWLPNVYSQDFLQEKLFDVGEIR